MTTITELVRNPPDGWEVQEVQRGGGKGTGYLFGFDRNTEVEVDGPDSHAVILGVCAGSNGGADIFEEPMFFAATMKRLAAAHRAVADLLDALSEVSS